MRQHDRPTPARWHGRRLPALAMLLAVALAGLTACGSDDDDPHAGSQTKQTEQTEAHGHQDDPGGQADPDPVDPAANAVPAPSIETWEAAGFSCHDFEPKQPSEKDAIRKCITANEQTAAMVTMTIADDKVEAWEFIGLPTLLDVDVTAAHQAAVTTVVGIVNPADAPLAAHIAAESTSSATWEYGYESEPLLGGGISAMSVDARLIDGPGAHIATPDSFELDLAEAAETLVAAGVECTVDDAMWTTLNCNVGDATVSLTTDPEAADRFRGISVTSFAASAQEYPAEAAKVTEMLALIGSPEIDEVSATLQQNWTTGGPKYIWIKGVATLILPFDSPSMFKVDGTLLPPL